MCSGRGYGHPASLPTPETTPDVEDYLMSNSADSPGFVCFGIGGEHPTSIQLSKPVHRTVHGNETPDATQPRRGLGCGLHPNGLEGLMI